MFSERDVGQGGDADDRTAAESVPAKLFNGGLVGADDQFIIYERDR